MLSPVTGAIVVFFSSFISHRILKRQKEDKAEAQAKLCSERVSEMILNYERLFKERGSPDPLDALEFHLYHLARYWIRLVSFCRQVPLSPTGFVDGDLGVCVEVGSEFVHKMIGPDSPISSQWLECWNQTQKVLHERPVTPEAIEAASRAFDACLRVKV